MSRFFDNLTARALGRAPVLRPLLPPHPQAATFGAGVSTVPVDSGIHHGIEEARGPRALRGDGRGVRSTEEHPVSSEAQRGVGSGEPRGSRTQGRPDGHSHQEVQDLGTGHSPKQVPGQVGAASSLLSTRLPAPSIAAPLAASADGRAVTARWESAPKEKAGIAARIDEMGSSGQPPEATASQGPRAPVLMSRDAAASEGRRPIASTSLVEPGPRFGMKFGIPGEDRSPASERKVVLMSPESRIHEQPRQGTERAGLEASAGGAPVPTFVEVTIGRLEVRAQMAPSASMTTAPMRRPEGPRITLADHLKAGRRTG